MGCGSPTYHHVLSPTTMSWSCGTWESMLAHTIRRYTTCCISYAHEIVGGYSQFLKNMRDLSWTRISIQVITHWNSIATYMYNNGSAGWECLAKLLASDLTNGMVCDIGLPVEQHGFRYNCRVYGLHSQILLIWPKIKVANDGKYRDLRWNSSWKRLRQLETRQLPECIKEISGQTTVLSALDTLYSRMCKSQLGLPPLLCFVCLPGEGKGLGFRV